jgi:hypothetical protein
LREDDFFDGDLRELDLREEDLLELLFFALDFFALLFFEPLFFADDFFEADFFFAALRPGGGGTFAPSLRASDKPIAMACFGFFTLLPLPDFSLPRLNSCISRSTDFCALGPYLRPLDFFFAAILTSMCAGVRILPS